MSASEIFQSGAEWGVSFTRDGKRYNLGLFPSRLAATRALRGKLQRIEDESAARHARRRVQEGPESRNKPALVDAERDMDPSEAAGFFSYDPDTGALTSRSRSAHLLAGGTRSPRIVVGGREFYAQRFVFAVHLGRWPASRVAWRNGVRDDLRWTNLVETIPPRS